MPASEKTIFGDEAHIASLASDGGGVTTPSHDCPFSSQTQVKAQVSLFPYQSTSEPAQPECVLTKLNIISCHNCTAKGDFKIIQHHVKVTGREPDILGISCGARQRPAGCRNLQELVQFSQPPPRFPAVWGIIPSLFSNHSQTLWDQAFQSVLTETVQCEFNQIKYGGNFLSGFILFFFNCQNAMKGPKTDKEKLLSQSRKSLLCTLWDEMMKWRIIILLLLYW